MRWTAAEWGWVAGDLAVAALTCVGAFHFLPPANLAQACTLPGFALLAAVCLLCARDDALRPAQRAAYERHRALAVLARLDAEEERTPGDDP